MEIFLKNGQTLLNLDNNFGNKFCPTLPQADPICLDGVNGGISQECRDGCTNYAYTCVSTCYGNSDCISACQQQESLCVNNCPCYGQCPNGWVVKKSNN